jgi:hypothetical protein
MISSPAVKAAGRFFEMACGSHRTLPYIKMKFDDNHSDGPPHQNDGKTRQ